MKASKRSRWVFPLAAVAAAGVFAGLFPAMGARSLRATACSPKETMTRFMGEGSGLKGVLLAVLLGSAAAGPLYAASPVAAVFMRKGVSLANVFVCLGAWSTTRLPMFLFEASALGAPSAFTPLAVNILGIILIAFVLAALLRKEEADELCENAEGME